MASWKTRTVSRAPHAVHVAARRLGYRIGLAAAAVAVIVSSAAGIPPHRVLFDATKAEMAGNADWVLDADTHNVGTGSGGTMAAGRGTDSNPQRFPTPPQSGITASTAETYWNGALSSWGVALVKQGMTVETLPIGERITFNDPSNPQDLSNYSVFVLDEPNIAFTAAEKAAIISWVAAGGGLFMISDHAGSDRNNDGIDSVGVWNGLLNSNALGTNPFGLTFNAVDVSPTSTFVDTDPADPVIRGPGGTVSQMIYHNGATISINTAQNASAGGAIWSASAHTNSNVMVAYAGYGLGRVVALGDSSPFDDGTGDSGDTLYNGWSGEANGDHAKLAINATVWLDHPPVACANPVVQPVPGVTVADGASASLAVSATGSGTLSYQWRRGTTPLTDDGQISGSGSATLMLAAARLSDAGTYDVVVSDACGTTISNPTVLTVTCRPDFNADGVLSVADIFSFLGAWFMSDPRADFNGVSGVEVLDIFTFLGAWFGGC